MQTIKRKVIFWAFRKRPSLIMRGLQLSRELAVSGVEAESRFGPSPLALHDIRNAIIVCIKSCPVFPWWIKKNKNKIIYDAIDYFPLRGLPADIDAIISTSRHMQTFFESMFDKKILVRTIYHHADQNLQPHTSGEEKLRLVYNGELNQSLHIHGEIPELTVLSFRKNVDWRKEIQEFNAHFSARLDKTKSVIKLANVSKLKAIFLGGAEPGCVELLGEDYPYFLRNHRSLKMVREDIERLKFSIGDSTWRMARQKIEDISDRLSIENSVKEYKKLFHDL